MGSEKGRHVLSPLGVSLVPSLWQCGRAPSQGHLLLGPPLSAHFYRLPRECCHGEGPPFLAWLGSLWGHPSPSGLEQGGACGLGVATAFPGAKCHGGFGGLSLEEGTLWTQRQKATVLVCSAYYHWAATKQHNIYFLQFWRLGKFKFKMLADSVCGESSLFGS